MDDEEEEEERLRHSHSALAPKMGHSSETVPVVVQQTSQMDFLPALTAGRMDLLENCQQVAPQTDLLAPWSSLFCALVAACALMRSSVTMMTSDPVEFYVLPYSTSKHFLG